MSSYDVTRRLIDAREEMRALYGASYAGHSEEYQKLVRQEMDYAGNDNPIDAALTLAQIATKDNRTTEAYVAARMALAAALDVIEAATQPNEKDSA